MRIEDNKPKKMISKFLKLKLFIRREEWTDFRP
jgi:hypothetical protein